MNQETTFLGQSIPFWIELKQRADSLDVVVLLHDLAEAHAKVSYYEKKLDEIGAFRKSLDKN